MPGQVANFLDQAKKVIPNPGSSLENQPLVPFQTALKLTREQEKKMIEHAFKRKGQLERESGRDKTIQPNWWLNSSPANSAALASQGLLPSETFLGKRSRYDCTFGNDVTWRPFTFGPDNIFYSSNIPVPVVRRVCRQMIARAKNRFFGDDPWFSVDPAPVYTPPPAEGQPVPDTATRADQIEKFVRFKLGESQSNSAESSGEAIKMALVLGECAVKTTYVVRDQIFNVEARVLHSIEGEPVRAADGNFITEEDQYTDAQDGTGRRVLARDGQTEEPLAPIWQTIPLDRRQVLFEGTKSEVIYYKDFLCPLTAKSVQEADTIIHFYDKPVMEFVDLVVKRGMVDNTAEGRMEAAQKMIALVAKMASNSPQPKSASDVQIRPGEHFTQGPSVETGGPVSEFAEFYLWYDANGDGIAENIMLICDRVSQAPIFYDHVANVTTDGLRPIEIVRVNPVQGRWYGCGIMELFESYQSIIDLLVNRWNFSQSRSGRVDFWRPTNTQEGDRDPNLKMNYGMSYTLKPGVEADETLVSVYLNDIKFSEIQTMFQFFLQLLYNESGVMTANDGEAAGADSSDLATGLIQNQQAGDELFKPTLQDLRPSLQNILTREVDVTLANINQAEAYEYLEGDETRIGQITPEEVRGLKYKVKINLGMMDEQKQIQLSTAACAVVERFYMLEPIVQEKVAELYRQQLRALCPRCDAKVIISPLPPRGPTPEPTKKTVSVSIKGEDLDTEQRDELLREDFDVQAGGQTPAKLQNVGSVEKPGEPGPATEFQAQLSQRVRKKAS